MQFRLEIKIKWILNIYSKVMIKPLIASHMKYLMFDFNHDVYQIHIVLVSQNFTIIISMRHIF